MEAELLIRAKRPEFPKFPLVTFLLIALSHSGCGNKDSSKDDVATGNKSGTHIYQSQEPFKDWVRERFQDIVIVHPASHPHSEKFADFAKVFSSLSRQTCLFLKIEPQDSIVIYFYTGLGQGYSITKHEAPFSDGFVIHFWFPGNFGSPIVKHLIPIWDKEEPRYKFLKEGLITLLDGAGQNYHGMTLNFIDDNKFIELSKLSNDTTINSDKERYQSAEAASFVDFVVYAYDINHLKELYDAKGDFQKEVKRIFAVSVSDLEKRWKDFIKTFAPTGRIREN